MKLKNSFLKHSIRSLPLIFLMGSIFYATYYTIPKSSFASDSLVKVLQTKGWIESNFQSQEIYYLGKRLDPNFNFLLVQTIVSAKGEKIGPFPFANTLIATPFVWIGHPEWILYLSAFLFGLYLIILYMISKKWIIPIVAMISTPLFHHFISFSDVSIAATLVLLGILILQNKKSLFLKNHSAQVFLSGILLGIACWYRQEVFVLTSCLIFFTFTIKIFSKKEKLIQKSRRILPFLNGFLLIFSIFIFYNFLNYGFLLGPRIILNKTIANFDLTNKMSDIQSLLFAGNGRLGFLGYSPWYFFIVLFFIWKWKKTSQYVKIWILTFVSNLVLVSIFTPNNSNIDWGSRYLTCSVFIPLLLLSKIKISMNTFWFFRKNSKLKNIHKNNSKPPRSIRIKENYKKLILFGFLILILYSISVNFKMIQLMRKISIQLSEIQSEIPWDNSKIFITSKSNIANTFGLNYLSQTILMIKKQRDLIQILQSHPNESFILIEDKLDKPWSESIRNQFTNKLKITIIKNPKVYFRFTEIQSR
ncbi:LA_3751/LA_3752 family putative glycosyltransferase [Leptospira kirschneri]|uniref:Membrane protein n=1 Tax=Leptospira kirschneri str. 200802841 TaxID=1193047 RepID=A0A828Y4S2_9LEPT|nr:hypothetical protein [Leptospira kirschneri]EKO52047.1 putative membrane protein [Leptospira kirschneri str. 200802841]EKR06667.1 putative membrane protein [Leptospira kirschneri serovar Valbuzzi str. 200702274]OOV49366.1 hypothetical protein B1J94_06075 [Leptospira kirschneri serovar Grippotyphosa]UZW36506.1 hypothetical protein ORQ95_02095 [Leptospira kirschneri]WHP00206.1 hypothetical protein QMK36_02100 [Leptospira kirschneri]